jgi:DNA mismatch repair protein MutS2
MSLESLPGLGGKLADRLREHFEGDEGAMDVLRSGDIARLTAVDGVSPRKALTLARAASGDDGRFLATREAERLHARLVEDLRTHASSAAARERLALLTPVQSPETRQPLAAAAIALIEADPENDAARQHAWRSLGRARTSTEKQDRVVVTRTPRPSLAKFCRVLTPSKDETWRDYRVFKQVSWIGEGGPSDAPDGWLVLPEGADDAIVLPEATLGWFRGNASVLALLEGLLEAWPSMAAVEGAKPVLKRLAEVLPRLANLPDLLAGLHEGGEVARLSDAYDRLWPTVKRLEAEVKAKVEEAMGEAQLALSGADMLAALADAGALQRRLRAATSNAIDAAIEEAMSELTLHLEGTGVRPPRNLFNSGWPLKIDRTVVDAVGEELERRISADEAATTLRLARTLAPLRAPCEAALEAMIELDQWLAVARWSMHHRCTFPTMAEHGISVVEGRHPLLGFEPDAVTYGLGRCAVDDDQQSVALLSGANSGGKTTLLELLGLTCILAHMGLPVPAAAATVGRVERLEVLAKAGGTQSAGALEQTLVDLASVVSDPASKLILADELEAITEPGAGARIIAGMLLAAEAHKGTAMVLVTHLAPAIIEATKRDDLRIDGIEARGLDEHLELVVDRTPRRNHLARSTPELIVRRLVERSEGPAREVFRSILDAF